MFLAGLALIAVPHGAQASGPPAGTLTPIVSGNRLAPSLDSGHQGAMLLMSGPGGYALSKNFGPDRPVSVDLAADAEPGRGTQGVLVDGKYRYELSYLNAAGEPLVRDGVLFVENVVAVPRSAKRAQLADAGSDLVTAAAEVGTEAVETDLVDVIDVANDGLTWLMLDADSPGGATEEYWAMSNDYGTLKIEECGLDTPDSGCQRTVLALRDDADGFAGFGTSSPQRELHMTGGFSDNEVAIRLSAINYPAGATFDLNVRAAGGRFRVIDAGSGNEGLIIVEGVPDNGLIVGPTGVSVGTLGYPEADLHVATSTAAPTRC